MEEKAGSALPLDENGHDRDRDHGHGHGRDRGRDRGSMGSFGDTEKNQRSRIPPHERGNRPADV